MQPSEGHIEIVQGDLVGFLNQIYESAIESRLVTSRDANDLLGEGRGLTSRNLPQICSQMLDEEDFERPKTPSLHVVTEDEAEELFYKVKEDSIL